MKASEETAKTLSAVPVAEMMKEKMDEVLEENTIIDDAQKEQQIDVVIAEENIESDEKVRESSLNLMGMSDIIQGGRKVPRFLNGIIKTLSFMVF